MDGLRYQESQSWVENRADSADSVSIADKDPIQLHATRTGCGSHGPAYALQAAPPRASAVVTRLSTLLALVLLATEGGDAGAGGVSALPYHPAGVVPTLQDSWETRTAIIKPSTTTRARKSDAVAPGAETPVDLYQRLV